jgi:hypothetical protein
MKRCSRCASTYTDDTLVYCLQDGASLIPVGTTTAPPSSFDKTAVLEDSVSGHASGSEPPPTEILDPRHAPTDKIQATNQTSHVTGRATERTQYDSAATLAAAPKPKRLYTAGIISIVLLLVAFAGIGMALLFRSNETGETNSNQNQSAGSRSNTNASSANNADGTEQQRNSSSTESANRTEAKAAPLKITASASSTREPYKTYAYPPANAIDGQLATAWMEGAAGAGTGEWLQCDFDREIALRRINLTPGHFKNPQTWARNNRIASATVSFSDGSSRDFSFPDRMQKQTLDVGNIRTRSVRITIKEAYYGADPDTSISEISFDWEQ